jgi:chromosome segregation ATPase
MNSGKERDERLREQAIQWLAEGDSHVKVLTTVLDEFARLHGIALTAERDTERMSAQIQATEQETQRLREGVGRLRADNARCMKEREDIAAALSQFMGEVLNKLRARPEWAPPPQTPPAPPKA